MSSQFNCVGSVSATEETRGAPVRNLNQFRQALKDEARNRADQIACLRPQVFLAILFLIGFIVRLGALLSLRRISDLPGRQEGADGIEFEQLARALAEGRGYVRPTGIPTSFRAPGFPIFMSLIYRLTHLSVAAANLTFPIIGAAVCVVTYLLAREVISERAARFSAILAVFYFPSIYFSTVWLSEPLFMLSLALSMYLFLTYCRSHSPIVLAMAGLLLSWSVLVRPFAILMLPALLLMDLLYSRRRMLTVPLLFACSLTPTLFWTARNVRVFHAFVFVATNGGSTFYGGNNDKVLHDPQYYGAWVSTVHLPGRDEVMATPNEYAHDQVEWALGKQWVRTHLFQMPLLIGMKLVRFVLPDVESTNRLYAFLSIVTYLPFVPLWIVGTRASCRRQNRTTPWLLMHLSMLATAFTAIVFWGSPRFRDAAAPVAMVYAGYGLSILLLSSAHQAPNYQPEMAEPIVHSLAY